MAYSAEISRLNPTCFVFLVDQSGSMADAVGNSSGSVRKADQVADVINRLLSDLSIRCAKEEGVRDYFHVGLIGYGGSVSSAFRGQLGGRDLVPLSEVALSPARLESRSKKVPDGAGGLVEQTVKFPVWVDPVAQGGTPMCEALRRSTKLLGQWLEQHRGSFPPVVLNVTDGESTDGDPSDAARDLQTLSSADGNALLFNLHISSDRSPPLMFPDSEADLPNDFARLLFRMSSVLPEHMCAYARQQGLSASEGTRGFGFNADVFGITQFFDIGTRVSDLR
jgi:hypothetical protein